MRLQRLLEWIRWRHPVPARVIVVLLFLGLNVCGLIRVHAKRQPSYAIERAGDAIRDHNASKFETAADVERIASSYYDQHLNTTAAAADTRPREVAALARRIRRWIETGRVDQTIAPRLTLLADFVGAAVRLSPSVREIPPAQTTVIATADLTDGAGPTIPFEMKLERQQGVWRIVEVTNVEEIVTALRARERKRIADLDQEIDAAARAGKPAEVPGQTGKFFVPVTTSVPATVTCSITCSRSLTYTALPPLQPGTAVFIAECPCSEAPCPPPNVAVLEVHRTSTSRTLRRSTERPLD